MISGTLRIALVSSVLLWGSGALGQGSLPATAPLQSVAAPKRVEPITAAPGRLARSEQAARDLARTYLKVWSEPNAVALASAASFYQPTVMFHGRTRTRESVIDEKRHFAERWPERVYRHLPETIQVACEAGGMRCTVWSSFDFSATSPDDGRRSVGIGEHELVVSLAGERPVIVAENSRVILRGHGNMSSLLAAAP